MTQRLYYSDEMIVETKAQVLETRPYEGNFAVILDKTLFYPESGGQLSDKGTINGIPLIHVAEEHEQVLHIIGQSLNAGATVLLKLDAASRIDHSQQHTGEHILSGLAHSMFGAANVGFHMADTYSTIDLDKYIEKAELDELERAANRAVQANEATKYSYVTPEELENIEIRKKAKGLTGEIRIVYAGAVDSCTCCGTHCGKSGDVGAIHISASMKYKGGVRLWFLCGMRAIDNAIDNNAALDKLAKRFSVKSEDVVEAVIKQGDELNGIKHELKEKTARLMEYRAAELAEAAVEVSGIKTVVTLEKDCSMAELKLLAENLCKRGKYAAVIAACSKDTIQYVLKHGENVNVDMREVCNTLNVMLDGKGGGREDNAQGSAKLRGAADMAMEQFKTYFEKMLRGK